MAKRIEKISPEIIGTSQTEFIIQRQTQDSDRRTLHVIRHIQKEKVEAMLVGIDAEKAFDSVRWTFLYNVLQKFGFHETIIKTIQAYKLSATVKVDRDLSN